MKKPPNVLISVSEDTRTKLRILSALTNSHISVCVDRAVHFWATENFGDKFTKLLNEKKKLDAHFRKD